VLIALLAPAVVAAQPATTAPEVSATPAPATTPRRCGLTIEASAGLGWIRTSPAEAPSYTSGLSVGIDVGAGAWVTQKLVVLGRISGLTDFRQGERLGSYLVGPSAQYWANDRWWVGGGLGVGVLLSTTSPNDVGFAFQLRGGYAFGLVDERVYTVAVEVTPARYAQAGESAWLTDIALFVGVQFL
jgi:hypothetical protein